MRAFRALVYILTPIFPVFIGQKLLAIHVGLMPLGFFMLILNQLLVNLELIRYFLNRFRASDPLSNDTIKNNINLSRPFGGTQQMPAGCIHSLQMMQCKFCWLITPLMSVFWVTSLSPGIGERTLIGSNLILTFSIVWLLIRCLAS